MIFRQLIDKDTSSYTYLLADAESREAVIIDPVASQVDRDLGFLEDLDLTLVGTVETHIHADHVTGGGPIRTATGAKYYVSKAAGIDCADVLLEEGDVIRFGKHQLRVIATPGHTATCLSYLLDDSAMVFTGDTLMVRGCGRTDFQDGDANTLFASVREKLFTLPEDTLVYPAHDYKGRTCSSIREERAFNPRLGLDKSEDEFVAIMDGLNLSYPRHIDKAVPGNRMCGCVDDAADTKPAPQVAREGARL